MSQMVIAFDSAMSPLLSAIHNTGHHQDPSACRHPASDPQAIGPRRRSLRRQGVDLRNLRRTNEPLIVPDLPDESGAASSSGVRTGTSRRATREPLNHRARCRPCPFSRRRPRARPLGDNGESVPAWVKTECCGPKDAPHSRPDQVRRNAAGGYVVEIYPDPIPAHIPLPSQDGDYWLFFYNDYDFYGGVRCFFVPALF
jgi:hypothetical protein